MISNSHHYSICFETNTTIISSTNKIQNKLPSPYSRACTNGTPNKDAFTLANILNMKIQIIPNKMIDTLQTNYKENFPHIKLWFFDINTETINLETINLENIVCIILFINGVYGLHFICQDNTQKEKIKIDIRKNYSQNDVYILQINTFDAYGKTKTSDYEAIDK